MMDVGKTGRHSLRNKFSVPVILFTVLLLLAFNTFKTWLLIEKEVSDLKTKSSRVTDLAALALQDSVWNYNTDGVARGNEALLRDEVVSRVRVTDQNRNELASSEKKGFAYDPASRIDTEQAIVRNGETIGYVEVGITRYFSDKRIRNDIMQAIVEIIVVGLLLLIVIIIISNLVTKPLRVMTLRADDIARGDLSVRIPVGSDDEISELAERFNLMAERLSEMFADIHAAGDSIANAARDYLLSSEETRNIAQEISDTSIGTGAIPISESPKPPTPSDYSPTTSPPKQNPRILSPEEEELLLPASLNLPMLTDRFLHLINLFKSRTGQLESMNQELYNALALIQQSQAQIIESEKLAALGSLVAGVAHEINTPLGVSITLSSFLERTNREFQAKVSEGTASKGDLARFMKNLDESVVMLGINLGRAADLIKNFKMMAIDQGNDIQIRFKLYDCVNAVLISLKHETRKKGITVENACPEKLEIFSFPGAFSQILINLIMNSVKHAFPDAETGRIRVACSQEGDTLRFVYTDDGKGIPPDILGKIYLPFFTTSRNEGNSGLGLNIVHNLVTQRLKGRIQCTSALEKGVTFTLTIPLGSDRIRTE